MAFGHYVTCFGGPGSSAILRMDMRLITLGLLVGPARVLMSLSLHRNISRSSRAVSGSKSHMLHGFWDQKSSLLGTRILGSCKYTPKKEQGKHQGTCVSSCVTDVSMPSGPISGLVRGVAA